jgi:hypothetical protein
MLQLPAIFLVFTLNQYIYFIRICIKDIEILKEIYKEEQKIFEKY